MHAGAPRPLYVGGSVSIDLPADRAARRAPLFSCCTAPEDENFRRHARRWSARGRLAAPRPQSCEFTFSAAGMTSTACAARRHLFDVRAAASSRQGTRHHRRASGLKVSSLVRFRPCEPPTRTLAASGLPILRAAARLEEAASLHRRRSKIRNARSAAAEHHGRDALVEVVHLAEYQLKNRPFKEVDIFLL